MEPLDFLMRQQQVDDAPGRQQAARDAAHAQLLARETLERAF